MIMMTWQPNRPTTEASKTVDMLEAVEVVAQLPEAMAAPVAQGTGRHSIKVVRLREDMAAAAAAAGPPELAMLSTLIQRGCVSIRTALATNARRYYDILSHCSLMVAILDHALAVLQREGLGHHNPPLEASPLPMLTGQTTICPAAAVLLAHRPRAY